MNEEQLSCTTVSHGVPVAGGCVLHAASHWPVNGLPMLSVQPWHGPSACGSGPEPHATNSRIEITARCTCARYHEGVRSPTSTTICSCHALSNQRLNQFAEPCYGVGYG